MCTEEAEIYCGICMGKIRISEIILPPSSATVRYNSCAQGIARVFAFILSFPCVLIVSTNSLKYIANNKIPDIILKSYESFCIIPVLHRVFPLYILYIILNILLIIANDNIERKFNRPNKIYLHRSSRICYNDKYYMCLFPH